MSQSIGKYRDLSASFIKRASLRTKDASAQNKLARMAVLVASGKSLVDSAKQAGYDKPTAELMARQICHGVKQAFGRRWRGNGPIARMRSGNGPLARMRQNRQGGGMQQVAPQSAPRPAMPQAAPQTGPQVAPRPATPQPAPQAAPRPVAPQAAPRPAAPANGPVSRHQSPVADATVASRGGVLGTVGATPAARSSAPPIAGADIASLVASRGGVRGAVGSTPAAPAAMPERALPQSQALRRSLGSLPAAPSQQFSDADIDSLRPSAPQITDADIESLAPSMSASALPQSQAMNAPSQQFSDADIDSLRPSAPQITDADIESLAPSMPDTSLLATQFGKASAVLAAGNCTAGFLGRLGGVSRQVFNRDKQSADGLVSGVRNAVNNVQSFVGRHGGNSLAARGGYAPGPVDDFRKGLSGGFEAQLPGGQVPEAVRGVPAAIGTAAANAQDLARRIAGPGGALGRGVRSSRPSGQTAPAPVVGSAAGSMAGSMTAPPPHATSTASRARSASDLPEAMPERPLPQSYALRRGLGSM